MKTYPEIEQLRQLDPVPEAPGDSDRSERLLRQILAEPRSETPRRGWKLRVREVGTFSLAAAAAAAVALIVLSGGAVGPSLLDRAYAAVNAGYVVVHEVDIQTERATPGWSQRLEGWLLPADGRARLIRIWGFKDSPFVSEWVITATGRAYARTCLSHCRPASLISSRDGWGSAGKAVPGTFGGPQLLPGTFAQWFRMAHRVNAIVPDGTTTFDGQQVARFESMTGIGLTGEVFWRPGTQPAASARVPHGFYARLEWYIDPATARPLGFKTWGCINGSCGASHRPADSTTRIVTFERLQPTSQNLADLTAPGIPGAH